MRIAYFALSVDLSAHHGGSTHIKEVCEGLTALGHEVTLICSGPAPVLRREIRVLELPKRPWSYLLAWKAAEPILEHLGAQLVMERYYNFAGQGLFWAKKKGIPTLLEVNAPMAAAPWTLKYAVDLAMIFKPMARWARKQADLADVIVTPLASTVPWAVPKRKVLQLPWGANVERFKPDLHKGACVKTLAKSLGIGPDDRVVVFHGSFRRWHGVDLLIDTAPILLSLDPRYKLLLVGGGERLAVVRYRLMPLIEEGKVIVTGPVNYEDVPRYLAAGSVSVAPFDTYSHPYLRHFGFYWSPLKVFEAMAMELPVVTTDVHPLNTIVRHGIEGLLTKPRSRAGLVAALERLLGDPDLCAHMGQQARVRVTEEFSWQRHCRALDDIISRLGK